MKPVELVERERAERDVLVPFAPEQLSDEELAELIDEAFAATGASTPQPLILTGATVLFILHHTACSHCHTTLL